MQHIVYHIMGLAIFVTEQMEACAKQICNEKKTEKSNHLEGRRKTKTGVEQRRNRRGNVAHARGIRGKGFDGRNKKKKGN